MEFTSDWVTARVSDWERIILPRLGQRAINMLEIGSHEGRSALWWADRLPEGSRVFCVDRWHNPNGAEARFDANCGPAIAEGRIVKIKAPSWRALRNPPVPRFDLAYIDGDHEARAVLTDAASVWHLLPLGGLMIFDDYGWKYRDNSGRLDPAHGIDAFLSLWRQCVEVLHRGYQVFVQRVK